MFIQSIQQKKKSKQNTKQNISKQFWYEINETNIFHF